MMRNSVPLLPATQHHFTTRTVKLKQISEAWGKSTVYVLREVSTEKLVYACSSGNLGPKFAVGTSHHVRHDQRGSNLGYFEVKNIVDIDATGRITSDATNFFPRNGAPVWVFK